MILYTFKLNYETGEVKWHEHIEDYYDDELTHHVDHDIQFKTFYAESLKSAADAEQQVRDYMAKLIKQLDGTFIRTWGTSVYNANIQYNR